MVKSSMVKTARKICEEYAEAKKAVDAVQPKINKLTERIDHARTPFEKWLCENNRAELQEQIAEQVKTVILFEAAFIKLGGKQESVIRQLYEQRKRWRCIEDLDGLPMSKGSIALERDKAFQVMEEEINRVVALYHEWCSNTADVNAASNVGNEADASNSGDIGSGTECQLG